MADWQTDLSGAQRDAAAALTELFTSYGLGTLAPKIVDFIQQGYAADTVALLLQQSPEYQARFAANTARQKAGLPVLSPAEYLSVEDSYRQIMSANGLPAGFYDQPSDFTDLIAQDVSPTEVQDRVRAASSLVNSLDPAAKAAFQRDYMASTGAALTDTQLVAYALDRNRAATILDQQVVAAQARGAAAANGLDVSLGQAETIARAGFTGQQAAQGVAQAAQLAGPLRNLSTVYGGDYTPEDALAETFGTGNPTGATQTRKRLASQERAAFGGSAATSTTSLTAARPGQL